MVSDIKMRKSVTEISYKKNVIILGLLLLLFFSTLTPSVLGEKHPSKTILEKQYEIQSLRLLCLWMDIPHGISEYGWMIMYNMLSVQMFYLSLM